MTTLGDSSPPLGPALWATEMKSKRKTAAELIAELEANPKFRAQQQEREDAFHRREEELAQVEAPLLVALAKVGIEVKSVWDLVNKATRYYPEAVPVLLDQLQRAYPDAIRDGIARALAVPEAKFAWELLTRLYREETAPRTKNGLAVAVAAMATDDVLEEVIALTKDWGHGASRLLLLSALVSSKDRRARQALMELGADPELQKEIQVVLRKKRSRR